MPEHEDRFDPSDWLDLAEEAGLVLAAMPGTMELRFYNRHQGDLATRRLKRDLRGIENKSEYVAVYWEAQCRY